MTHVRGAPAPGSLRAGPAAGGDGTPRTRGGEPAPRSTVVHAPLHCDRWPALPCSTECYRWTAMGGERAETAGTEASVR